MNTVRTALSTAAAFGLATLAPVAAHADREVPVAQVFQGTTCYKPQGAAGVAHLGHDGFLYNSSTTNRLSVTCPMPVTLSWDQRAQVELAAEDVHPEQAIECQLVYHTPEARFFIGDSLATRPGVIRYALPVGYSPDLTVKLTCEIPPKSAAGAMSSVRMYTYSAKRIDATGL